MKKFFTIFFVTLGVLFFVLLLVLAYLFVFDPLNLKPLFMSSPDSASTATTAAVEGETTATTTTAGSQLSPAQEAALKSVGIASDAVPTFTEVQLQCFEGVLGKARVDEIKAGAIPSATEFYKAKVCM